MSPSVPPQVVVVDRHASGVQQTEIEINESIGYLYSACAFPISFTMRWPRMQKVDESLVRESIHSPRAIAVLHDVSARLGQDLVDIVSRVPPADGGYRS